MRLKHARRAQPFYLDVGVELSANAADKLLDVLYARFPENEPRRKWVRELIGALEEALVL